MTKLKTSTAWARNAAFVMLLGVGAFALTVEVKAVSCSVDAHEYPLGFIKWVNCGYYDHPPCSDYWDRYNQCDQACRNSWMGWGGGFLGTCTDEQFSSDPEMWTINYMDCTCWG